MRAPHLAMLLPVALFAFTARADPPAADGQEADDADPADAEVADDGLLPPGWEGPLPADREHDLADDDARGLWLGAAAEAQWFDRDPWVGAVVRGGFVQRYVSARVRLPVHLRVWDRPPVAPAADGCRWLRCEAFRRRPHELGLSHLLPSMPLGLEPLRVVTLIDEITLGRPHDPVYARLAPARQTLGDGQLVDGVLSQPLAGLSRPGARASFSLLSRTFEGQAMVADAARPWELFGGQLLAHPLAQFETGHGWLDRVLSGLELGAQMASDIVAPSSAAALDRSGDVVFWNLTRPILAGSVFAAADLQTPGAMLSARPHVALSTSYGLSPTGLAPGTLGASGEVGMRVAATLPFVGFSGEVVGGLDSPGARTGLFSTLYLLERRRALAGAVMNGGTALNIPATGGAHGRVSLEIAVLDAVRLGGRGHLGSAPGTDVVEAFVDVAVLGARGSLSVLKRVGVRPTSAQLTSAPLTSSQWPSSQWPSTQEVLEQLTWNTTWWTVAEVAVPLWGPFTAYARWLHAPRFVAGPAKLRADDDVTVGLSGDVALDSPWLDGL